MNSTPWYWRNVAWPSALWDLTDLNNECNKDSLACGTSGRGAGHSELGDTPEYSWLETSSARARALSLVTRIKTYKPSFAATKKQYSARGVKCHKNMNVKTQLWKWPIAATRANTKKTELNRKRCIHKEKLRITNGQNKKILDQICNGALSVSGKA